MTIHHAQKLMTSAYRPIKQLCRHDGSDSQRRRRGKDYSDQFESVRLEWLLRKRRCFDDLKSLRLLIPIQLFAETSPSQFAVGLSKPLFKRFSLPFQASMSSACVGWRRGLCAIALAIFPSRLFFSSARSRLDALPNTPRFSE